MSYRRSKKEEAFALYCQEINPPTIAKYLNIKADSTVYDWVKKYKWSQKREEFLKFTKENQRYTTTERHKKMTNLIQNLFLEAVKNKKDKQLEKMSARDVLEAIKMERLINGESTDNVVVTEDNTAKEINDIYERTKKRFEKHKKSTRNNKR